MKRKTKSNRLENAAPKGWVPADGRTLPLPESKTHRITLTLPQLEAVAMACETLARIGMCQFAFALEKMALKRDVDWMQWHQDVGEFAMKMKKHTIGGHDGLHSNLGIAQSAVPIESQRAYNVYSAIREALGDRHRYLVGESKGPKVEEVK